LSEFPRPWGYVRLLRGGRRLAWIFRFCAAVLLGAAVVPTTVRAQDCGRPAIFWDTGSGPFEKAQNFSGAGGPVGCKPLPTDNVTFGAGGFPKAERSRSIRA
jgi:hypothetical protein